MTQIASATFRITNWDEKPCNEGDGLLRGEGMSTVGHGTEHPPTLNYDFDPR
jgi:hypothetical protein